MAIQTKLTNFPVPEDEWKNYILDQEINDRGIKLDMTLVRQANRCDEQSREELTRALKTHTGNVKRAAAALGVGRLTVYYNLKKYGMDPDRFRK